MRWVRVVVALFGFSTLTACFNPAVSPGERVARACDYYAKALESASQNDALLHLRDAAHWAELATEKDESYEALETDFGHIIDDVDEHDDVRPNPEVVVASRGAVIESCDEHAPPRVSRRIKDAGAGS